MTRHPLHSFRMSLTTGLLIGALYAGGVAKALSHEAVCAPWTDIKVRYAAKFKEVPVSSGIVNANLAIQVLASPDGETFTLVLVGSDGVGCIIAVGKGWEPGANAVKGEGRT